MNGYCLSLKKTLQTCHPERRATAREAAGAQVRGPQTARFWLAGVEVEESREYILYHVASGSFLRCTGL